MKTDRTINFKLWLTLYCSLIFITLFSTVFAISHFIPYNDNLEETPSNVNKSETQIITENGYKPISKYIDNDITSFIVYNIESEKMYICSLNDNDSLNLVPILDLSDSQLIYEFDIENELTLG